MSDMGHISDGYHTFDELYAHRVSLWIKLCELLTVTGDSASRRVWRSLLHSDGSKFDGWFVLGYGSKPGEQITYHLSLIRWDECSFADTLEKAPEFDGHSANDVLERILDI